MPRSPTVAEIIDKYFKEKGESDGSMYEMKEGLQVMFILSSLFNDKIFAESHTYVIGLFW